MPLGKDALQRIADKGAFVEQEVAKGAVWPNPQATSVAAQKFADFVTSLPLKPLPRNSSLSSMTPERICRARNF